MQTLRADNDKEAVEDVAGKPAVYALKEGAGNARKGKRLVRAVVNSGAEMSATPPRTFPSAVEPSAMSRAGLNFRAANNSPIKNHGQTVVQFCSKEGHQCALPFQVADIERPLISATDLTDAGNDVILRKSYGEIVSCTTGKSIKLLREGGVYILEMWVDAPDDEGQQASGFTRPGK